MQAAPGTCGAAQVQAISSVPTEQETASAGRKARILVVEDSVGVRELERVILESAGYDVVTAVDGLDGIARLAHRTRRSGALRRRDAGHGRVHVDTDDPPDPWLGARPGRDHDLARRRKRPNGPAWRPVRAPTCSRAISIRPSWWIRFGASSADEDPEASLRTSLFRRNPACRPWSLPTTVRPCDAS